MLVACGTTPKAPDAGSVAQSNDYLVNVQWLNENLNTNNLLLLDARGPESFEQGHIPGAIPVKWQQFAKMDGAPGDTDWGTVLNAPELSAKLSELGIDQNKTIIVYADPNGWGEDGRIVWMLRMAGLTNSKMLSGGWPAWNDAKFEVSKDATTPVASNFQVASLDLDSLATTDWLSTNLDNVVILDTRNAKEFEGATDFGEKRGGHIPGAINIPFKDFFNNDGTIKTATEVEDIMKAKQIDKNSEIVTYCTAGIRSAHMTMILEMAGYQNVKNYDASIYEWAANDALPMNK